MSNNNSSQSAVPTDNAGTSPTISLFFVAKYDSRTVAIRRSPDFEATKTSVQRIFPTLQSLHHSCIRFSAKFEEFGDMLIELHAEIWPEVVSQLTLIEVSTGDDVQREVMEPIEMPRQNELIDSSPHNQKVTPEPVVIHVQDTHDNINDLALPLFLTSTIRELKGLIVQHNDQLPRNLLLSFEEYRILEDHKELHEYGIRNGSTVLLTTEFEVYLVGSYSSIFSVNVVTFASIASLKLIFLNSIGDGFSRPKYYDGGGKYVEFALSCGGQALGDAEKLGSFNHLAPGCKIFINEVADSARTHGESKKLIPLRVYEERQMRAYYAGTSVSYLYQHWVFPESTILDLKLLTSNKDRGSPSRWARKFELTADTGTPFNYPSAWQTLQSYTSEGLIWLRDQND